MKKHVKIILFCIGIIICFFSGFFIGSIGKSGIEKELNIAIGNQQEAETRIRSIAKQLEKARDTIIRITEELKIERERNQEQRELNNKLIEANRTDRIRIEGIGDLNSEAEKIIKECLEIIEKKNCD